MMTANLRTSATVAWFIPSCLAIPIARRFRAAQPLSSVARLL
jgi:F0F1-type ATP synthase assembly protein I